MADERQLRKLFNTKQDVVDFNGSPSISGISDGQIAVAKSNNKQLAVYRKKYGKLWKSYMSYNGDQFVDKNLKVSGNTFTKNLTVKGSTVLNTVTITTATHQDAYDVSGLGIIFANTASVNVTIGGLRYGVNGQIVYIAKVHTSNRLTIEHAEGTGSQKIYLEGETDLAIADYGGISLVCDGSNWYGVGNVTESP